MNKKIWLFLQVAGLVLLSFSLVFADQPSTDEINEANNPLTPKGTLNLHDYYTGSYYDLPDSDANALLFRGTLPHKLFGAPQIMRATIPMATSPDKPGGQTTGIGDINLFDVILTKVSGVEVGVGPQITIPSANDNRLGAGLWQLGAAAVVISPETWGILGGLFTWQHSLGETDFHPTQNVGTFQPILIYNLPKGFYLRSSSILSFNFENGDYYIPVGAGAGKVWKLEGGETLNLFTEPQFTLFHEGVAPQFQLFTGLNFQFPLI